MKKTSQWLLPEGIEEVLPERALRLEKLRRSLLDVLYRRGFDLVLPPLVEFLDGLLTGVGEDLDLQTAKLTDSISGRLLGIRADHTPQIARIDAHYLKHEGPSRLCYCGSVFRLSPEEFDSTREPLQLGAELYGCPEVDADAEIVEAMVDVLRTARVPDIHVHLGHVGVYRALIRRAELPDEIELELFDALQRQSRPDVEAILLNRPEHQALFLTLLETKGPPGTLEQAMKNYHHVPETDAALSNLADLVSRLIGTLKDVEISVDLSDLRGYRYHTGVVFNAYTPGYGRAVAQGGRYDEIGKAFGRARSATGFSADLRRLLRYVPKDAARTAILAPSEDQAGLEAAIKELRENGERVVRQLGGEELQQALGRCDRKLVKFGGEWRIEFLK